MDTNKIKSLINEVIEYFENSGGDITDTYLEFSDRLTEEQVHGIVTNKYDKLLEDDNSDDRDIITELQDTIRESVEVEDVERDNNIDTDTELEASSYTIPKDIKVMTVEQDHECLYTHSFESVGFYVAFKNMNAKELVETLEVENPLELIPALRYCYRSTDDMVIKDKIAEVVLDVIFEL